MKRSILNPADLSGAALSDVKAWLAISNTADDALLTRLLAAATDACEAFTGLMPLSQVCEDIIGIDGGWQGLSVRPVIAVSSAQAIAADGSRSALAAGGYEADINKDGEARIRIMNAGTAKRAAISYSAGLAPGWGSLQAELKQGIIRLAAHFYQEKDSDDALVVPAAVFALWRPWRLLSIA